MMNMITSAADDAARMWNDWPAGTVTLLLLAFSVLVLIGVLAWLVYDAIDGSSRKVRCGIGFIRDKRTTAPYTTTSLTIVGDAFIPIQEYHRGQCLVTVEIGARSTDARNR